MQLVGKIPGAGNMLGGLQTILLIYSESEQGVKDVFFVFVLFIRG